ncbi:aldo/keto reductase [Conexibacter sp. DBS9H8]|uniref:aldo/keto reductase n=1 Tax=Conexibacter sp. DBS9H8 TaxID=2937801 RepID=UPI00200C49D7|nr:aldo/keto reductase [Conexibacter sp. DBS9H8]
MNELPSRPLGSSGLTTTIVGLGANNFGGRLDLEATRAVIDAALEAGITFIDTADVYGRHFGGASRPGPGRSEEFLGEVLAGRRDQVVLATKFGGDMQDGDPGPRGSAAYIRRAVEASLRRLRTDVIDLYWYHRPDGVTPIRETLEALDELVRTGTVRAIGASNVTAAQLREAATVAAQHGLTPFCALQNEYSLLRRGAEEDGTLAACAELGVSFIPYFPLASGLLTGKYRRSGAQPAAGRLSGGGDLATAAEWDVIEALERYAADRGLSVVQVAIGALALHPAVGSVIAGATSSDQVRANAAAATWVPTATDRAELRALLAS